jgi:hypothetical protein
MASKNQNLEGEAMEAGIPAPVIQCKSDSLHFLRFYCPHCKQVHHHSEAGWHAAKCSRGPYRETGYKREVV